MAPWKTGGWPANLAELVSSLRDPFLKSKVEPGMVVVVVNLEGRGRRIFMSLRLIDPVD